MVGVKGGARGQARRERARATRRRMLEAAYGEFSESGWTATTMAAIAARAGVAVQTVHFTFHTKARLLQEVVEMAAAGEDEPVPVGERPWVKTAEATPDGRRMLALLVEHGTEIRRRVAPLAGAIQAAASVEPEVAAYWRAVTEGRRAGLRHLVERLASRGQLRPGLEVQRAADILHVLHGPETFLAFTAGCGWSVADFKAWQYATLCAQLLGDDNGPPSTPDA
jgi:TetR/AcrR family transcriptional regulator of autoinduction and epiphytic fitness